jgi:hypothetical protein
MKSSDKKSKNPQDSQEESSLDDLLKKGRSKRKDDYPPEEFISSDPTRSTPENESGPEEIDKMGISKKAKNQASDERDVSKNKK